MILSCLILFAFFFLAIVFWKNSVNLKNQHKEEILILQKKRTLLEIKNKFLIDKIHINSSFMNVYFNAINEIRCEVITVQNIIFESITLKK